MTTKRPLALAATIGVIAGLVAAVAIPTAQSTTTEPPFLPLTGRLTTEAALTPEPGTGQLRPHPGTVREELRQKDPAGGPDWVIRSMIADRVISKEFRRPGQNGVIGSGPCLQLGRDVGGRFGWIDGDHVFRPVSARQHGQMTACVSAKLDTRKSREPRITPVTLVGAPTSRTPSVRGTLVWGAVGSHVNAVDLLAAGRVRTPRRSKRWGAFLEFYGPGKPIDPSLRVRYSDGQRVDTARQDVEAFAPPGYRPARGDAIDPDSWRVIARAPDPGGGPSWGVYGMRTKRGLWCLGHSGHLIADHVGELNPKLGILWDQAIGGGPNGCGSRAQPTKQYPVQSVSSSGSYTDVPGLAPDRKQLRLQAGRTVISGRTLDGIDALTVSTPRDVRTVIPSEPGHGFVLVYDGGFPGGELSAVAHFRDGHTKKVQLAGGGL